MLTASQVAKYHRVKQTVAVQQTEGLYMCRVSECGFTQMLTAADGDVFTCKRCGDQHCVKCKQDPHPSISCSQLERLQR